LDENTKKKILKMLSKAKKENKENPGVSPSILEDELNMEDHELDMYIRDLKYRGYIEYDGSQTYKGQDISITTKGEKYI
jgi:DNA-binding MarR family transcriptional regulator